jgi:hypothetical protein
MDRSSISKKQKHLFLVCAFGPLAGCVSDPYQGAPVSSRPVPTKTVRSGDKAGDIAVDSNSASNGVPHDVILCSDKTSKVAVDREDPTDVVVTKVSFAGGGDPKVETHVRPAQDPLWQVSQKAKSLGEPFGDGTEPVRFAQRKSKAGDFISGIANAEQLVQAKVVKVSGTRSAIEFDMPQAYDLSENQQLILVDHAGNIQVGSISAVQGKRISVKFDDAIILGSSKGDSVRVGLLNL